MSMQVTLWVARKEGWCLKGRSERPENKISARRGMRCGNFPALASSLFSLSLPFSLSHATWSSPQLADSCAALRCSTANSIWDIKITQCFYDQNLGNCSTSTGMCLAQLLTEWFPNQIIKQYGNACLKRKANARFAQCPVLQDSEGV